MLQKRGHAVRSCMGVFSFRIWISCVRGCHSSCSMKIRFANPTKRNKGQTDTFTRTTKAVLCRNPKHSPTGGSSCCSTITIIICGSTPFIVLFLLLPLLLILLLPLPFLDDADDYIHPPDSEPYNNNNNNNNNSYSVVDKRPCRSNISKPIDTPSKQERETSSQAQPASTFTDQDEDDFLSWAAAVVERLGSKRPMAAWQHECNP